jgi:hypothetical protein
MTKRLLTCFFASVLRLIGGLAFTSIVEGLQTDDVFSRWLC